MLNLQDELRHERLMTAEVFARLGEKVRRLRLMVNGSDTDIHKEFEFLLFQSFYFIPLFIVFFQDLETFTEVTCACV